VHCKPLQWKYKFYWCPFFPLYFNSTFDWILICWKHKFHTFYSLRLPKLQLKYSGKMDTGKTCTIDNQKVYCVLCQLNIRLLLVEDFHETCFTGVSLRLIVIFVGVSFSGFRFIWLLKANYSDVTFVNFYNQFSCFKHVRRIFEVIQFFCLFFKWIISVIHLSVVSFHSIKIHQFYQFLMLSFMSKIDWEGIFKKSTKLLVLVTCFGGEEFVRIISLLDTLEEFGVWRCQIL